MNSWFKGAWQERGGVVFFFWWVGDTPMQALNKLTQIYCKNINICFLENWQFLNHNWLEVQPKLIFNDQYFIYFMDWRKLGSSTRATLTNSNFQFSFCEFGKKIEVSLRLTFKNLHSESKDELKNTMSQFEFHCWKKKGIYIK